MITDLQFLVWSDVLLWFPPLSKETLDSFQRQVRQFAMTTQQDLEVERAQLLTRIALLEGENEQLQTYIDQHLVR